MLTYVYVFNLMAIKLSTLINMIVCHLIKYNVINFILYFKIIIMKKINLISQIGSSICTKCNASICIINTECGVTGLHKHYKELQQLLILDYEINLKKIDDVRKLLINSQEDMLRIIDNSKQNKIDEAFGADPSYYNCGFFAGCIKSLEYACKHITNILIKSE